MMHLRCERAPMRRRERRLEFPKNTSVVMGVSLDSETLEVRYSTQKIGPDKECYIPLDSVQKKVLTAENAERLQRLLEENRWAMIEVADSSTVERIPDKYDHTDFRFEFKAHYERFYAHRLGPCGLGHHLSPKWKEIEDIILS